MTSLLEEQLEEIRKKTAAVGVTPEMASAAPVSDGILGIEPPKHWTEQAIERDGKGKFFGKMLLGGFTGLTPLLFPEMIGSRDRYKAELDQYQDNRQKMLDQQQMMRDITTLNDGIETPEDALARARMLSTDGLGTIDKVQYALTGDKPGVKPNMVSVTNNGQVFMVDKDNPTAPAIPVTTPDGQPIRNKLDQWQVDNIGAFDRMVPRLEALDEMERNGMAIPRATMTQLRAYEALDSDGRNVIRATAFGEWMEKYLTPEQRRYILAAEDAGMIVLRDESGAAISASEILRQMNQYLMFDDLDAVTRKDQREARTRKAGTLMTGMPDYIKKDRQAQIDWVENYDGTLDMAGPVENMTTARDNLPSMTQQDMAVYLRLLQQDERLGARYLELLQRGNE